MIGGSPDGVGAWRRSRRRGPPPTRARFAPCSREPLASRCGLGDAPGVAQVELTQHLPALFPSLRGGPLQVEAVTVAELVAALDGLAPGVAYYICDERGRLRRHVNIFVDGELLVDRQRLCDRLEPNTRVFIAQALSGG
jgi:molybdopterin synthase sulfur carrier subunit